MPLEKFFSGEGPINVKDLTIENPEKEEEPWFDPEKEITEEDWGKIKALVGGSSPSLTGRLNNAKILSPERLSEFNINKNDILTSIKGRFKNEKAYDLEPFSTFKQIFPEKASEIETYYDWNESKNRLMEERRTKNWADFQRIARDLKILHPERTAELGLDGETWDEMKKELKQQTDAWHFTLRAASMRLLYPGKFDELEINQDQKKRCNDMLRKFRKANDTRSFLYVAASLKILSAEEAYVDDNGMIVVNMRKKQKPELEPETPPMPEKRNF